MASKTKFWVYFPQGYKMYKTLQDFQNDNWYSSQNMMIAQNEIQLHNILMIFNPKYYDVVNGKSLVSTNVLNVRDIDLTDDELFIKYQNDEEISYVDNVGYFSKNGEMILSKSEPYN